LVIYVDVRSKLHDQIDVSLIQAADSASTKWLGTRTKPSKTGPLGKRALDKLRASGNLGPPNAALWFGKDSSGFFQVIPDVRAVPNGGLSGSGAPLTKTGSSAATLAPKLAGHDAAVARGLLPAYFRDVRFAGAAMRLYTVRLPSSSDGLVRTLRPLTEANA